MTKVRQASGQAIIAKIVPSGATNLTTLEITGENPDGRLFNIARYTVDNTDGNAYLSIMVEKERTIRYLSAMNSWETKTAYGKAWKGYKSAKKMNETLAKYGLTLEQVKEMLKAETENAADEIDTDEYAVSADAQEIAINAEIDNAAANNSAESVTANYQKLNGKYYYNGKEISRNDAIENAVFDILNLNRKTYTENFISEVTEKFENDGYRNGLNCVGIIRARGNAIVAAQNGEVYSLPDGDFALHGNKIFDLLNHELASFDTKKAAENAADELEKAFERGDMTFSFATDAQAEVDVIDVLKATVKAQREKSRKSVIDWNAIYHDIAFAEIFALQDELKKSLKLGEIDRAVNIFDAIKTAYKKTA